MKAGGAEEATVYITEYIILGVVNLKMVVQWLNMKPLKIITLGMLQLKEKFQ